MTPYLKNAPAPAPTSDEAKRARLCALNLRRQEELLRTPLAAAVFDVDGVVRRGNVTDERILQRHAELIQEGMVLCPCTARGETVRAAYLDPLRPLLAARGVNPASAGLLCGSRAGAITEHPFSGEVLDHHPLAEDLSEALLNHALIRSLLAASPPEISGRWESLYNEFEHAYRVARDPRAAKYPAAYLDRHPNGLQYKITLFYQAAAFQAYLDRAPKNSPGELPDVVMGAGNGVVPAHAAAMAMLVERELSRCGIQITADASFTHPYVDITAAGVDKSLTYYAVRARVMALRKLSCAAADRRILTLGDSPLGNDAALLACGIGVTNVEHLREHGPIMLSFEGVSEQVERAAALFSRLRARES